MCGIAALIRRERPIDQDDQLAMGSLLDLIEYRGPDRSRAWHHDCVLLGHRRLSIIDLSEAGSQPFHAPEHDLHVVFNGEIYNYRELRADLQSTYDFKTGTDTEVLLAAYLRYGPEFLSRLRGMFAFVLVDGRRARVMLARDRLGKKPIYYTLDDHRLIVTSEIKAFHAFPEVDLRPDPESVEAFFALQYIPGPFTIYKNVRRLLPGHSLFLDLDQWVARERAYWSLGQSEVTRAKDVVDEVAAALEESVRYRLVSDVEVGVLLSGGLDSTLVSYYAQEQTDRPIRAFTVGFESDRLDESPIARRVASELGMPLVMGSGDHVDRSLFERVTFHADEPLGDPACIPTYLIAGALSQHVKVVLSGEGADELFFGYPHYVREALLGWLPSMSGRKVPFDTLEESPTAPGILSRMQKVVTSPRVLGAARWTSVFGPAALEKLLPSVRGNRTVAARYVEQFAGYAASRGRGNAADHPGLVDLAYWLPDDLMVKVDRMTMAHSVEARAPFLDHHLVELVVSLPRREKKSVLQTKKLLRQVAREKLPGAVSKIVADRGKHGFEVPLDRWIRGELRGLAEELLAPGRVRETGMLDCGYVTRLWDRYMRAASAESGYARKMWSLLCFMSWQQHHERKFGIAASRSRARIQSSAPLP